MTASLALQAGRDRPSSEWRFHRDIYVDRARRWRNRPRAFAVRHDAGLSWARHSGVSRYMVAIAGGERHSLRAVRDVRHPGALRQRARRAHPAGAHGLLPPITE